MENLSKKTNNSRQSSINKPPFRVKNQTIKKKKHSKLQKEKEKKQLHSPTELTEESKDTQVDSNDFSSEYDSDSSNKDDTKKRNKIKEKPTNLYARLSILNNLKKPKEKKEKKKKKKKKDSNDDEDDEEKSDEEENSFQPTSVLLTGMQNFIPNSTKKNKKKDKNGKEKENQNSDSESSTDESKIKMDSKEKEWIGILKIVLKRIHDLETQVKNYEKWGEEVELALQQLIETQKWCWGQVLENDIGHIEAYSKLPCVDAATSIFEIPCGVWIFCMHPIVKMKDNNGKDFLWMKMRSIKENDGSIGEYWVKVYDCKKKEKLVSNFRLLSGKSQI